jgi:ankyrin
VTGATPLNEAAFRGNSTIVRYLLQQNPDLSMEDKAGYTPLQNAIRKKRESSALLLLDAEATRQHAASFYPKLMAGAARAAQTRVLDALLKLGAPADSKLPSGSTPLSDAVSAGSFEAVQLLLEHGADGALVPTNGVSLLTDASLRGFKEIAALLLDNGAPINYVDKASGATALYAAASFGKSDVVSLLLDHGADPNLCSSAGTSPYQTAVQNGYAAIARAIKDHGGSVSCKK